MFTVKKVTGFKYKMWDAGAKKMVTSDQWQEGFQKRWSIDTEKGVLELSNSQLSQCLMATFDVNTQTADISGKKFGVKTNGKTGIEIRYFFSLLDDYQDDGSAEVNVEDIPF